MTSAHVGLFRWPFQEDAPAGSRLRIGPPERLTSSRDGKVLAQARRDGAWVFRAERPYQPIHLRPHDGVVYTAVSCDGHWVATGPHVGLGVKVWDAATGKLVKELLSDVRGSRVGFSPDDRWLVTTGHGLRLWSVGSWREELHLPTGTLPAFTSDGCLMAVEVSLGVLALLDPETGREFARLEDPNQDGSGWCTFTADGTQLLTSSRGDNGNAIHIWDLRLIRQHLAGGEFAQGLADLRHAEQSDPARKADFRSRHATILNGDAWRLVAGSPDRRDPGLALERIRVAVEIAPNDSNILNTLGVVLFRNRKYAEAIVALEKSLAAGHGTSDGFDLFFLAMCHARLGEAVRAKESYNRALKWPEAHREKLTASQVQQLEQFRSEAESLVRD